MRNLEYLPRQLWWVATKALQRRPKLRVLIRKSKENQKRGREEMKREGEGEKWKGEKEVRNLREREGEGLGFSNEEGKALECHRVIT